MFKLTSITTGCILSSVILCCVGAAEILKTKAFFLIFYAILKKGFECDKDLFLFFIQFNQENFDSKVLQIEILFEESFSSSIPILKYCSNANTHVDTSLIIEVNAKFKEKLESECNQFLIKSQYEDKYQRFYLK